MKSKTLSKLLLTGIVTTSLTITTIQPVHASIFG